MRFVASGYLRGGQFQVLLKRDEVFTSGVAHIMSAQCEI